MKTFFIFTALFSFTFANYAFAKDSKAENTYPAMTEQMRLKIADMHQHMATCLKTGKTFEDCHKDMSSSCHEFSQMIPMRGSDTMQKQGLMIKGHPTNMKGYPGMMNGFCQSTWLPASESQESKIRK